jgi:hypothetical protein
MGFLIYVLDTTGDVILNLLVMNIHRRFSLNEGSRHYLYSATQAAMRLMIERKTLVGAIHVECQLSSLGSVIACAIVPRRVTLFFMAVVFLVSTCHQKGTPQPLPNCSHRQASFAQAYATTSGNLSVFGKMINQLRS